MYTSDRSREIVYTISIVYIVLAASLHLSSTWPLVPYNYMYTSFRHTSYMLFEIVSLQQCTGLKASALVAELLTPTTPAMPIYPVACSRSDVTAEADHEVGG